MRWTLRDSMRSYWLVEAVKAGRVNVDAPNDYFETAWKVTVESEGQYRIQLELTTQYAETLSIDDIARDVRGDLQLFYDAALLESVRHAE